MDRLRQRPGAKLAEGVDSPGIGDASTSDASVAAGFIRDQLPTGGLLAGLDWRISPFPFGLDPKVVRELESLGRVLLQFNRAVNLLYRRSAEEEAPGWIAQLLDQGKPAWLVELQRSPAFKNDLPRVIRPDLLWTEDGLSLTELDSVPGGIGLTAWLNQAYERLNQPSLQVPDPAQVPQEKAGLNERAPSHASTSPVLGGADGMLAGFAGIFDDARRVHIVVSEESATYRPEMEWLASNLGKSRFQVTGAEVEGVFPGDAVYRFFELFDLANVACAGSLLRMAQEKQIRLTPPPKPIFEEKLLLALVWNRNLRDFWRQELGESFFGRLLNLVPYTWVVDPMPLPPHAAIPELNLTDWQQLKTLSQRERELVLKVSGFSAEAWGARGVYLGSDLSLPDWSAAVDQAIAGFPHSPRVLQRYRKPKVIESAWYDFAQGRLQPMAGRVRLCPYYFVHGDGEAARAHLGGVLATICPADKKIIHGMKEAILAPCAVHPDRPPAA